MRNMIVKQASLVDHVRAQRQDIDFHSLLSATAGQLINELFDASIRIWQICLVKMKNFQACSFPIYFPPKGRNLWKNADSRAGGAGTVNVWHQDYNDRFCVGICGAPAPFDRFTFGEPLSRRSHPSPHCGEFSQFPRQVNRENTSKNREGNGPYQGFRARLKSLALGLNWALPSARLRIPPRSFWLPSRELTGVFLTLICSLTFSWARLNLASRVFQPAWPRRG
jgi:hypothetical protein